MNQPICAAEIIFCPLIRTACSKKRRATHANIYVPLVLRPKRLPPINIDYLRTTPATNPRDTNNQFAKVNIVSNFLHYTYALKAYGSASDNGCFADFIICYLVVKVNISK